MACISGAPSEVPEDWFLTNEMKAQARADVNGLAHSKRMFSHAIFTPGYDGWMEQIDHAISDLKPDSMKGYTIGDNTNKNLSKHPWRMDDEKLVYPAYEKFTKAGLKNVCVHKGLFPPSVEKQFPHLLEYSDVRDVGKAAKDWPQLNFIIYHGGYRFAGGGSVEDAWAPARLRARRVITDLSDSSHARRQERLCRCRPAVRASTIADPVSAVMIGQLIKGLGAAVCWERMPSGLAAAMADQRRRLEIPEGLQKYALQPLGEADGLGDFAGGNNAAVGATTNRSIARSRTTGSRATRLYAKHGAGRTNLRTATH